MNREILFKGKAIYNPSGKAGEYSYWACNFYVGCPNGCTYCYCKKGVFAKTMGMEQQQLKSCFKNPLHALEVFEKEVMQNLTRLQEDGLFFSFTTDPLIMETNTLTWKAAVFASDNGITINFLTKRTDWVEPYLRYYRGYTTRHLQVKDKEYYRFGFTLTGRDELEPNASTNQQRIEAIQILSEAGYKTWVSLEPIVTYQSSFDMVNQTIDYCKFYKIGLMSGEKINVLDREDLMYFVNRIIDLAEMNNAKIYFKESITKHITLRESNCLVDRTYKY